MDGLALTTGINTLAVMIANCLTPEETALAAAVFTQLGDTLTTILTQQEFCGERGEKEINGEETLI